MSLIYLTRVSSLTLHRPKSWWINAVSIYAVFHEFPKRISTMVLQIQLQKHLKMSSDRERSIVTFFWKLFQIPSKASVCFWSFQMASFLSGIALFFFSMLLIASGCIRWLVVTDYFRLILFQILRSIDNFWKPLCFFCAITLIDRFGDMIQPKPKQQVSKIK